MGGLSPIHWAIMIIAALLLFGWRGKLSGVMGDAAKGIRAFRDGLKDEPATDSFPVATSLPAVQTEKDPIAG